MGRRARSPAALDANGLAGPYTLNLFAPQTFSVTTPLTVGSGTVNGAAVAGAGTFETTASQDIYTFAVPTGGQTLNLYGAPARRRTTRHR